MIIFNNTHAAVEIGDACHVIYYPGVHSCLARVERNAHGEPEVRGGAIFTDFNKATIQIHCASVKGRRWLTRELLWHAFNYGFVVCGCSKLIAPVPETNTRALDLNKHLGFTVETVIGGVFLDGGLLVMSMRREDCRFLDRSYLRG